MTKTRPVVKSKLREWFDWLVNYVPEGIRKSVQGIYASAKKCILALYDGAKKTLMGEVEEEAKEDHAEDKQQPNQDFTPEEHKNAHHRTFRSFRIPGIDGTDVDGYLGMVRSHVKTLIEKQVKDMGSAKVQCSLWILWKKPVEGTSEDDTSKFIEINKVFHSNMAPVFQGSVVEEVLDTMLAQVKTYVENPALPNSGFTINRIMHLDVDFHKLKLSRGSSYIEAPKWIATKKAIINPQNKDEECFKWSIIAALHHEDITSDPERISKLRPFADEYNWHGIEFPMSIKEISKFEKNNPDIAVNVLYVTGKTFNILCRSTHNEREKQVNLLLLTDIKKSHYIAIENLSRLLGSKISKNHAKMHFCMNCLQAFPTIESRDKHYEYCMDNEAVKIAMPTEQEKWLYYKDGQQQFKVPFAIYTDFESLLVPITEDKRETKTKKLNKHVPCGWCTYSTFAYGDISYPLQRYRGKDCVKMFVQHLEDEVKRLYATFPQHDMLPLTEVLQRGHEAAKTCHICMKSFDDDLKNRKVRDHCHYTGLY
ncbi:uncharacterized protein LOC130636145 [Hydractinia symbiolongicarpus]|uniref:uncharacterized protein LOC130636145 n=1 Tax=Hydractinia symbiolongicarpus TaxID=13093 RepID=UPI0025513DBB|nr:uncharacterized protein LOC130636145 [Hydractinia symbiolongicarpus]